MSMDDYPIIWTTKWDKNTLEKACKKVGKTKEIDVFFSIAFTLLRFCIPTSLSICVSPIFQAIGPNATAFDPCGIQWG
jgi:hypothetical protein